MRRRILKDVLITDLAGLVIAGVVASTVVLRHPLPWAGIPTDSVWPMLGSLFVGALLGEAVAARVWATTIPRPSYVRALIVFTMAYGTLGTVVLLGRVYWSRGFLVLLAGIWLPLMVGHRFLRRRRPWVERYLVVSADKTLIDDLTESENAEIVAVIPPGSDEPAPTLPEDAAVVVDLAETLSDQVSRFVSSCVVAGVDVRPLASVYEEHTGKLPVVHLSAGWEVSLPLSSRAGYEPIKRALDLVTVVLLAPLALLVIALAGLMIRLESPGPVIFRQRRVGRHGQPFTLLKLRTMRVDAELDGPRFAEDDDDRVTRIGRLLRRLRIDELPQLWNVAKGDLSIVGPRPEQEAFVRQFEARIPFYGERHLVRPGITGWAQVHQGYAAGVEETIEKLRYDLFYVKHMSFWLDARIVGKTIATILTGSGSR